MLCNAQGWWTSPFLWSNTARRREFLRSMIPHHSSAILMCRQAPIRDPQIRRLCASIITGQQREIDQMNAILARRP